MLSLISQKTTSQKQSEENVSNFMSKNFVSSLCIEINSISSGGNAPLHLYAETNNILLGAHSLHRGADVDVKTKDYGLGKTLLYISTEKGHKDLVELLLKWKANVN